MAVEGGRFSTFLMLGDHHQEWHQNLLVNFFHNCGNFILTYIFHDALQPLKPWINLKNTYIMCCNCIEGHNKSQKML
jgi:hypothetical protein